MSRYFKDRSIIEYILSNLCEIYSDTTMVVSEGEGFYKADVKTSYNSDIYKFSFSDEESNEQYGGVTISIAEDTNSKEYTYVMIKDTSDNSTINKVIDKLYNQLDDVLSNIESKPVPYSKFEDSTLFPIYFKDDTEEIVSKLFNEIESNLNFFFDMRSSGSVDVFSSVSDNKFILTVLGDKIDENEYIRSFILNHLPSGYKMAITFKEIVEDGETTLRAEYVGIDKYYIYNLEETINTYVDIMKELKEVADEYYKLFELESKDPTKTSWDDKFNHKGFLEVFKNPNIAVSYNILRSARIYDENDTYSLVAFVSYDESIEPELYLTIRVVNKNTSDCIIFLANTKLLNTDGTGASCFTYNLDGEQKDSDYNLNESALSILSNYVTEVNSISKHMPLKVNSKLS